MKFDGKLAVFFLTRGSSPWDFIDTLNKLELPPNTMIDKESALYISRARNDAVIKFLKTDREYLCFLDDDNVFPRSNIIMRLLSHEKDFVGGLYFNRRPPYHPIMLFRDGDTLGYKPEYLGEDYPKDQLVEVDSCGGGIMLIRRKVFETIPPPWFELHDVWKSNNYRETWYEDIDFCVKAKKAGFQIFVDTGAASLHLATIPIGPKDLMDEWWKSKNG